MSPNAVKKPVPVSKIHATKYPGIFNNMIKDAALIRRVARRLPNPKKIMFVTQSSIMFSFGDASL